jgi:O-acetylhomoserine (thiol)-lyase
MRSETVSIHGGFAAIPRHTPSPCRSIRMPLMNSRAPIRRRRCLISKFRAFAIAASPIRPSTCSKSASPCWRAASCLATASGQAALAYALLTVADRGGSIVAPPQLYGTTHTLLAHTLKRNGIEARFAKSDRPEDIAALIDDTTRAVFCESVGNPAGNICDIEALAEIAHGAGAPLIVDNTVATPILMRPIDFGADIVVHSLTKFMGGHGVAMGGAIVDAGRFDWRAARQRFPMFSEPDESYHGLVYVDRFGREAFIARARSVYQRTTGAVLAPMSAFLILQGIETLALRVERHVENARIVAKALRADARVAWVEYAGFEDHRYHAMAKKYLNGRVPSLLTFGVRRPRRGQAFLRRAEARQAAGQHRRHPHALLPSRLDHAPADDADEQTRAGVSPETMRLCVGVEHVEDILEDLDQALGVARRIPASTRWLRSRSDAGPRPRSNENFVTDALSIADAGAGLDIVSADAFRETMRELAAGVTLARRKVLIPANARSRCSRSTATATVGSTNNYLLAFTRDPSDFS